METKNLQITAGRGPAECTWVVAQVLKKLLEEAESNGLTTNVIHREKGFENGTVETALVQIEGKNVTDFCNNWIGTIQWIGKSTFRKMNPRKNWFIGIFEVKQSFENEIDSKDIQYQAMRSSGAGGQHVNKVSSAIRATHLPTGISVIAMDSRSQHKNKQLATQRLLEKLKNNQLLELKNEVHLQWNNQLQVQRGNPIKTFEGTDFKKEKKVDTYKKERQKNKLDLKNEHLR